jgi:anthranilate/para-aminobenzoate synthase component II
LRQELIFLTDAQDYHFLGVCLGLQIAGSLYVQVLLGGCEQPPRAKVACRLHSARHGIHGRAADLADHLIDP